MVELLARWVPAPPGARASLEIWGVFGRLLGLVYFAQFASALPQVAPLLGRDGIEPARLLLRAVRRDLPPPERYLRFPTLLWLHDGDAALRGVCLAGIAASIAIVTGAAGAYTPAAFAVAWACWLSIVTPGSSCFGLPWDKLVLETGFIALFTPGLAPLPDVAVLHAPSPAAVLALRWLVFRVMFGMGLAKFRFIDQETRTGTFLQRYYDRQPMPTVLAFYARLLPLWFHKVCLALFFLCEMVVPFFAFGPWPGRAVAGAVFIALQLVIWLTGNYGVFNLVVLVLSVPLFAAGPPLALAALHGPGEIAAAVILAVHFVLTLPYAFLLDSWSGGSWLYSKKALASHAFFRRLGPLTSVHRWIAPFFVVNAYGIFVSGVFRRRRMSTVIQGSDDGEAWRDYEPRFLPCSVSARPLRFAPHHPRFDHHFYYERGLASYRTFVWLWQTNPYYLHPYCFKEKVVQKLLRGAPSALSLFRNNPFPGTPPRWIRYSSWVYEFTTPEEKARTGCWWRRELVGVSAPIGLDQGCGELAGIHDAYRPFLADSVCYIAAGVVAYVDPTTGEKVPIQLHPIEIAGPMPS